MRTNVAGWLGCAVAAGMVFAVPGTAQAGGPQSYSWSRPGTGYTITMVARKCPAYTDIMANRARNNIMESLKDVGKDSVYSSGQAVDPTIEQDNDPNCTPLDGWQFEMGSNYTKPGQLSVVTGSPLVTTGDTRTVEQLDAQGKPTGKVLKGAVVYPVTSEQYQLAQQGNLWVQGGTVQYPQMENRYGSKYGFGVLRCAVDNQNADNVEHADFPSGYKNIFCYAYYVDPAPTAATVTITKKVTGSGVTQGFTFDSNMSYDPSGTFSLQVSNGQAASEDFIRADSTSFGGPYNVKEEVPSGWTLDDISCSDTNSGASTTAIDKASASVAITLAAGDHVTCTYTDSPPKSPTLAVWKVTSGHAGGPFTFDVAGPVSHTLTATTTAQEQPAEATDNGTAPTDYTPGSYTITEALPAATKAGSWSFEQAYCNGHSLVGSTRNSEASVSVTLEQNVGQDCVFRNKFTPAGRLILRLKTIGGTATGFFLGLGPGESRYRILKGTTRHDSVAVDIFNGRDLAFGRWAAYSAVPSSNPDVGVWELRSFTCTGISTAPAPQARVVTLSEDHPKAECLAVYTFVRATHVEVVKTATGSGPARSGPAVVQIDCVSDAGNVLLARGQVVLARDASRATLPEPLVLHKPATCTVRETATGALADKFWTGHAKVNGQGLSLPGTFPADVPASPALYLVTVHNAYASAAVFCRAPLVRRPASPGC